MNVLDATRTLLYAVAGLEAALLAFLYHFGYDKIKNTAVIASLRTLFVFLAVLFFYLAVLPILRIVNQGVWSIGIYGIMLPMIPVIWGLQKFIFWTLEQGKKQ